jgi:Ca2+-binding EF-hand superfamily protein
MPNTTHTKDQLIKMAAASAKLKKARAANAKSRKEAYQRKIKEEKKLIETLLEKYDGNNSGTFDKAELKKLLSDMDQDHIPDEASLDFIMGKLQDENGEIVGKKIPIIIQKYKNYMKDKDKYDNLFLKHDKDKSGKLEDHQLLEMMKEVARGRVDVNHGDLTMLVELTDNDKSGAIEANEVKAAMAEWNQMIELKIEKRRHSAVCVLL